MMIAKRLLFIALTGMLTIQSYSQQDKINFSAPQKLTKEINSSAEEGLPILSSDLKTLYFARTFHPKNVGGDFSGQDIWKTEISSGVYSKAQSVSSLNDEWSNAVIGIAQEGQRLYLMNQMNEKGQSVPGISTSDYDGTEQTWSKPLPVNVPGINIPGTFYSAYVSPNESFILWTIPTTEDDTTSNDLFVSEKVGESWGSPINLGTVINTSLNEISPFFHEESELLFFSTNGKGNPDNYDIYYAKRLNKDWQNWTEPTPAGINSAGFDAYFFMGADSSAYFSSNRNDSLSNLYLTQVNITSHSESEEDEMANQDDSLSTGEGDVKRDPVLIVEVDGNESRDKSLEDLTRKELLDKETVIRFVYFEFDKFSITAKYIEVLDDVAAILDKNQDVSVTLNGHTDAVASEPYNQILSENRAASTKEWLVINGIDPDRIITVGFGELQPYASNMTAEGRALNRRVEITFKAE